MIEPHEKRAAERALKATPHTIIEPSDALNEMIVARAGLRIAAMIIRGELALPDWNIDEGDRNQFGHSVQAIVDYCISRVRMSQ